MHFRVNVSLVALHNIQPFTLFTQDPSTRWKNQKQKLPPITGRITVIVCKRSDVPFSTAALKNSTKSTIAYSSTPPRSILPKSYPSLIGFKQTESLAVGMFLYLLGILSCLVLCSAPEVSFLGIH